MPLHALRAFKISIQPRGEPVLVVVDPHGEALWRSPRRGAEFASQPKTEMRVSVGQ